MKPPQRHDGPVQLSFQRLVCCWPALVIHIYDLLVKRMLHLVRVQITVGVKIKRTIALVVYGTFV